MVYDNSNSGALFTNDKKNSPNHPDYSGNIEATCAHCGKSTDFWLASWIKIAKGSGKKFFSLALTEKDNQGTRTPQPKSSGKFVDPLAGGPLKPKPFDSPPNDDMDFDDDIPF